jgi:hypothetical protein
LSSVIYFFKAQDVPKPFTCPRGKSLLEECRPLVVLLCPAALPATFMFMTAWDFEARLCPTLLNEIKKTKLQICTSPQAGINILLWAVRVTTTLFSYINCYCSLVFSFPNCHCVKVNVASLHEQVHLCFNFFSVHLSKSWN